VSVGQMEIVAVHLRSHVIRVPARRYGECGQPPTRSELLQLRTADEARCSLAPSDLGTGILASAYGSASPGRMTLLRPASRLHDTGVNYRSREPRSHNARSCPVAWCRNADPRQDPRSQAPTADSLRT
jgi:hypothetical protein